MKIKQTSWTSSLSCSPKTPQFPALPPLLLHSWQHHVNQRGTWHWFLSIWIIFLKYHHCPPLITCMWIRSSSPRWEEVFNSPAIKSIKVTVTGLQMLSSLFPLPPLTSSEGWSSRALPGQHWLCSPGSSTVFPLSLPLPTRMEDLPQRNTRTQLGVDAFLGQSTPTKAICSWQSCNSMSPSLYQAATAVLCATTEQRQLWFQSHVTMLMPAAAGGPVYSHGSSERFGTAHHPPLHILCMPTFLKVHENPVWSLLRRGFPKSQRK